MELWKSVLFLTPVLLQVLVPATSQPATAFRSRFKSLDRVINRLDGLGPTTKSDSGSDLHSSPFAYGHGRANGSKLRELLKTEDFPDPADEDEDDDSSYDDDNETEVLSDNTAHWSYPYKNGVYRSKFPTPPTTTTSTTTTTTTTTTPPPPPPQLSFSQMKWRDLGTSQALEQTRLRHTYGSGSGSPSPYATSNGQRSYSHSQRAPSNTNGYGSSSRAQAQPQTPDTSTREAINHALRVSREGSCKVSKPKLVRVQDFYPHPGKRYLPHCTILHQCSDDTGCCRHDVLTCSPKTTQRVELYFYAVSVDGNRAGSVERLVFYNHTECECRDRMEDLMPRDVSVPPGTNAVTKHGTSSHPPGTRSDPTSRIYIQDLKNNKNLQCKCPSEYTERVLPDGSCTCDCFDKQRECLRLKRGRDFFTMQDKWCIQSGRCEIPGCAYGSYIHLVGRCPRKKERYGQSLSWHRYLTQ